MFAGHHQGSHHKRSLEYVLPSQHGGRVQDKYDSGAQTLLLPFAFLQQYFKLVPATVQIESGVLGVSVCHCYMYSPVFDCTKVTIRLEVHDGL